MRYIGIVIAVLLLLCTHRLYCQFAETKDTIDIEEEACLAKKKNSAAQTLQFYKVTILVPE